MTGEELRADGWLPYCDHGRLDWQYELPRFGNRALWLEDLKGWEEEGVLRWMADSDGKIWVKRRTDGAL